MIALKWYIDELNDIDRRMLKIIINNKNDLIEWITWLINRFKKFNNVILQNLFIQWYIVYDAVNYCELREYV